MTIDKETSTEILRLYHAEKWKIGTIARQLGVHHSTVRRVLKDAEEPPQPRRRSGNACAFPSRRRAQGCPAATSPIARRGYS